MAIPNPDYNAERQALAKALSKHFGNEAVGKMLGITPRAVHHLVNHKFKKLIPNATQLALAESVGAIFEHCLAVGTTALIAALREAAEALEIGEAKKIQKPQIKSAKINY